jgi:hypothetical protein
MPNHSDLKPIFRSNFDPEGLYFHSGILQSDKVTPSWTRPRGWGSRGRSFLRLATRMVDVAQSGSVNQILSDRRGLFCDLWDTPPTWQLCP